jgi:hypothetical protein
MTRNTKTVSLAIIASVVVMLLVLMGRDVWLRHSETLNCDDGTRHKIDLRDFSTQYSAYSLQLEASIADKASLSTKLSPVQLQQLSEAMQNAQEFRKYVVAGFNSCAVSRAQYVQLGARFQALDNVAREINELTKQTALSPDERLRVTDLIKQYRELARKVGFE